MQKSCNHVELIGILTAKPVSGVGKVPWARFSLKIPQSNPKYKPPVVNVVAFYDQAKTMSKFQRGGSVKVLGRLDTEISKDEYGKPCDRTYVIANAVYPVRID